MNITITNTEILTITRDGELDGAYYDAMYALKRREALKEAGRQAMDHLRDLPQMIVNAGYIVVEHMTSDPYADAPEEEL